MIVPAKRWEFTQPLTLSETAYKAFTAGEFPIGLRVTARYTEGGKAKLFTFEGMAKPNFEHLDIVRNDTVDEPLAKK